MKFNEGKCVANYFRYKEKNKTYTILKYASLKIFFKIK